MIKKFSIIFTLILVFNIFIPTTKIYAQPVLADNRIDILNKNYEDSVKNFKPENLEYILSHDEYANLLKYQEIERIPVYFYCNNSDFVSVYNDASPIRLAIDLLSKQLGLNLDFQVVFVDSDLTFEEQIQTRASNEVAFDLISSNNLTLFDNKYPEIRVSTPLLSENLYIVSRANQVNDPIDENDILSYDSSVYSLQSQETKLYKTRDLDVKQANSSLVSGLSNHFLTTNYNLPTVTKNSTLLYRHSVSSAVLPNILSAVYGLGVNSEHSVLIDIIDKATTKKLIYTIQSHSKIYDRFIKEFAFYNSLTPIEIEYLKNHEYFTVYYNENHNLLEKNNGVVEGFIPDIVNKVSALTGLEPSYSTASEQNSNIDITSIDALNLISMYTLPVAEHLVDTFNSHEDTRSYSSSRQYFAHPIEVLRHYTSDELSSINQLKFASIGTISSFSLNAAWFMRSNRLGVVNLKTFNTLDELTDALIDGTITYALVPPGNVNYYTSNTKYGISTAYINQDIGINNSNLWTLMLHDSDDIVALTSIFSKAVSTLSFNELMDNWFPPKTEYIVYNDINNKNNLLYYTSIFLVIVTFSIVTQINKFRKENLDRVSEASSLDTLTGLKNYYAFAKDKKSIKSGYLIIGYISKCKRVNQIYGMNKTDQIIERYANLLANNCGKNSVVYRISGDMFYILIPEFDEEISLQNYIKNLYALLSKGVTVSGRLITLKWNLAGSPFSLFNDDIEQFISITQELADDVKTNPKLNFAVLDSREYENIKNRTKIYDALKNITTENMYPFYQPFVDSQTLKVKGCEVLARLNLDGEIIPAYRFIDLADKIGTLGSIDKMILEKTVALRTELLFKGIIDNNFYFSINFSAQFLRALTSEHLYNLSRRYGIKSFDFLQIEILEEELSETEIFRIKRIIREFNLKTAIDDFSTGHSTISRLNNFNFDVVKMDRSLLPINFTDLDKEIYKSLIQMVEGFSGSIVVEGVETKEHLEFLQSTNIDTLQGFYFAKPMAKSDFIYYILNTNLY